jgi:biopolymer transport protein ExbD
MVYKRHLDEDRHKLEMAPMVDIVFLLLIFFLVATDVRPTEADFTANLPAMGEGIRPEQEEPREVSWVYITNLDEDSRAVRLSINGAAIAGERPWHELTRRLLKARSPNMMLVIDGDPSVKLKWIVRALDCAVEAEVPRMTLGSPKKVNH